MGGALGLAVLATVSTTRTNGLLATGHSVASALTGGYHLAFVVSALLVVTAIVVGIKVLPHGEAAKVVQIDQEPEEELVAC